LGFNAIPVSPVTPFNVLVPVLAAANTINTPLHDVAVGTLIVLKPDDRTVSNVITEALESEITIGPIVLDPVKRPVTVPVMVICPVAAMLDVQFLRVLVDRTDHRVIAILAASLTTLDVLTSLRRVRLVGTGTLGHLGILSVNVMGINCILEIIDS
jgi:hypothetical protein